MDDKLLNAMITALQAQGAQCTIIAPKLGEISGDSEKKIKVDQSFLIATSVVFDAVYIAGGANSVQTLIGEPDALHFVEEAYKHCKPIAAEAEAIDLLNFTSVGNKMDGGKNDAESNGVILGSKKGNITKAFINAIKQHRFWNREKESKIPA